MIPIFIGGSGRSGTTILLEYLENNQLVYASNPIELRILTEQYGLIDLHNTKDIESFLFYLEDHWLKRTDKTPGIYSNLDIDIFKDIKERFVNDFSKNNRQSISSFYKDLFINQKTFKTTSLYYGDSTPSNIKYADEIFKIFGDCKFINMIRDGRDTAYSIFQMKDFWALEKRNNELDALDWWYNRIIDSFNALSKVPDNYYLNIRLEDFVSKESERKKILSFLSLYESLDMEKFFKDKISEQNVNLGKWKNLEIANQIDKKYSFMLKKLEDRGILIERYY
jgi:hypothetical protein